MVDAPWQLESVQKEVTAVWFVSKQGAQVPSHRLLRGRRDHVELPQVHPAQVSASTTSPIQSIEARRNSRSQRPRGKRRGTDREPRRRAYIYAQDRPIYQLWGDGELLENIFLKKTKNGEERWKTIRRALIHSPTHLIGRPCHKPADKASMREA